MRIPFLSVLISLAVLTLLAVLIIRGTLFTSGSGETGQFSSGFLSAETTLERSATGHVTISARSHEDIYAGLGFAHARDRTWQLQRVHWVVNSRFASVFGDEFLPADQLTALLLHTDGLSPREYFGISDRDYAFFERYAAGINAWIHKNGRNYSIQFTITNTQPSLWTADDVIRTMILQQWLLETGWQQYLSNSMVARSLPQPLFPYLFSSSMLSRMNEINFPDELTSQTRSLLRADTMLRDLLNAPGELPAVRSISQRGLHNDKVHFMTFQSGPQAPSFWYDVSLQLGNTSPYTSFTIPGSPVLWAGSGDGKIWLPQSRLSPADMIITADSMKPAERFILESEVGSRKLFRFPVSETGFLPKSEAESNASAGEKHLMFRRIPRDGGAAFGLFHDMLVSIESRQSDDISIFAYAPDLEPENSSVGISTGYSEDMASYLNAQALFNTSGLLLLQGQNVLETHPGSARVAEQLSEILSEFDHIGDIGIARQYLSNWNGQYDRYAVAATITELSMMKIAENALRSYLEPDDFSLLLELGLIDQRIGIRLTEAHYEALQRNGGSISPVTNAFFARRIQEVFTDLRSITGEETFEWRWGNVNKNTFTDHLLCGSSSAQNRSHACARIEAAEDVPVLGQQDLLNAALIYSDGKTIGTQTLTTGVLQTIEHSNGSIQTTTVLLPGPSSDPFSIYYSSGLDIWPPFSPAARATESKAAVSRFTLLP